MPHQRFQCFDFSKAILLRNIKTKDYQVQGYTSFISFVSANDVSWLSYLFTKRKKILDWSKLKAFADNKTNVTEKTEICFGKGRKHSGKRRKCWLPAFSPFSTMFSKGFFLGVVKSRDCVVKS